MIQTSCRLRNFSIISVLALTVSNVFLTLRLLQVSDCGRFNNDNSVIPRAPVILTPATTCLEYILADSSVNASDRPVFSGLELKLGRWDTRRMFKIFDYGVVGEKFVELSRKLNVTLATQSSIEKIFSLVQVSHHWSGAISATVYAAGDDELYLLQLYLTYLRHCFTTIRERIAFHLVIPKERSPSHLRGIHLSELAKYNCAKPEQTLNEMLKQRSGDTKKWRIKYPYPQNLMRNIARKNCQTYFVFLTDVDIIVSANMNFAEQLDKFLRKAKCSNINNLCAYVIPTFELDERVRFPRNKTDLIRLANKGLARPFHNKVFIYNQYATNFSRWQSDVTETEVKISHAVTNFEFLYEPFFVAPDNNPAHDERFIGYGYTRNTQVYEMFVAGYQFQVLTPLFTIHWGLQNKKGRPAWREHQNNINRKHFEIFKREVFARYHKDPLKMLVPKKPRGPNAGNSNAGGVAVG
ncbi:CLUMA_CG019439, isoform A [Clunio marinus]|uniref:Beta-1,4-glucuronyltransferase 1 n=1 Tax=Clunio marinus TaxID=568069 RepID=A0A1J1J723_9DIPT|nr:CLUMA_CG019439, isoform A [Clunio marinus]